MSIKEGSGCGLWLMTSVFLVKCEGMAERDPLSEVGERRLEEGCMGAEQLGAAAVDLALGGQLVPRGRLIILSSTSVVKTEGL